MQNVMNMDIVVKHYDYYSGEPLDEDLYQKGRDDELREMQDYGVYVAIPIREAVGGKHIRGFSIAHRKGDRVKWRFVATEVNTEFREDKPSGHATIDDRASNHQSCWFVSHFRWSLHEKDWILGCQESVFNADLNEVHPWTNLCKAGHFWWLRKALYGTRMASQMWGETVRAVMDSGGMHCLQSVPNAYYLPADGGFEDDSCSVCHGDDFLAEGSERTLERIGQTLE